MSADVYIEASVTEWQQVGHANATYNLGPMLHEAGMMFKDFADAEKGEITVAELQLKIRSTLVRLRQEPERYRAMNPPNGWGTYEGLVEFLESIAAAIASHPGCRVRTWL